MSQVRLIGAVHPVGVDGAGSCTFKITVPDLILTAWQDMPGKFLRTVSAEQA